MLTFADIVPCCVHCWNFRHLRPNRQAKANKQEKETGGWKFRAVTEVAQLLSRLSQFRLSWSLSSSESRNHFFRFRSVGSMRRSFLLSRKPLFVDFCIRVEFFLAPFFFLVPVFFLGGWLVSAKTVPLLQAVAGRNYNFCRVQGFATQHSFWGLGFCNPRLLLELKVLQSNTPFRA